MRRIPIVVLGLALVLGACGGGDDDAAAPSATTTPRATPASAPPTTLDQKAAGDAMVRLLQYASDGQYGREWDELHPLQQAFVPRTLFVKCADDALAGIDITDVKVKETFLDKSNIPGTDVTAADSVAVTLTYVGHQGEIKEPATDTFHAFWVDGRWRWVATEAESYKQGQCPDA